MRLLAITAVLAAVAVGQWSEPVSVGDSTGYLDGFQLAEGGGDTLWAFYLRDTGGAGPVYVLCRWSMGDAWSAEETLATAVSGYLYCLSSGIDPQGRIWLSWYDGAYYTLGDTCWAIWTCVHDSLGWGNGRLAMPMSGVGGLNFAADKLGDWYMGICYQNAPMPDLFSSALYSRFDADTWTGPYSIAVGYGDPLEIDYGLPSLVARPDTGFWAVYTRSAYNEKSKVLVDHLLPDSSWVNDTVLYDMPRFTAAGDSAGQMWIIYVDTLGAIRSITYDVEGEKQRQLVTADRRSGPAVCTDQMGWVWLLWTQSDTTLVVSYNRGSGWSAPEVVTSKTGYPEDIVSDQRGRIYVGFNDGHGRYWTCYRAARPGVGGNAVVKRSAVGCRASVVRALPRDIVAFDAMGRRVPNPKPGIYFVREAQAQAQALRKVVITR
jgi:hypothetical protein